MLVKLVLLAAFVYAASADGPEVYDENDMIDYVMEGYQDILNETEYDQGLGGTALGCCPVIVRGPKGSVIQPFTGWRGNVALIVDWGTCTVNDKGFRCCVRWGDGTPLDCKSLDDFGPCQLAHQYPQVDSQYTVVAYYCSNGAANPCKPASCCRSYARSIDTSYDPGKQIF